MHDEAPPDALCNLVLATALLARQDLIDLAKASSGRLMLAAFTFGAMRISGPRAEAMGTIDDAIEWTQSPGPWPGADPDQLDALAALREAVDAWCRFRYKYALAAWELQRKQFRRVQSCAAAATTLFRRTHPDTIAEADKHADALIAAVRSPATPTPHRGEAQ